MRSSINSLPASVLVEGGAATIVFERYFSHPPGDVWKALTDSDALSAWYLADARIDAGPGGSVDFSWSGGHLHVTGRILEWDPPHIFEHEWNVPPSEGLPDGEKTVVRWELTADSGGTLLRLTHRNLSEVLARGESKWLDPVSGMHVFLDRLVAFLDGLPMPDWLVELKSARARYFPDTQGRL